MNFIASMTGYEAVTQGKAIQIKLSTGHFFSAWPYNAGTVINRVRKLGGTVTSLIEALDFAITMKVPFRFIYELRQHNEEVFIHIKLSGRTL